MHHDDTRAVFDRIAKIVGNHDGCELLFAHNLIRQTHIDLGSLWIQCSRVFSRGSTNVGNGEIAGFVYVPQETFTTDYYMQIYLKVKGAKELTAYTDAYDTTVAQAKEQVESIEKERCTRRQEEIKDEAQEKVSDARKELADKKGEALSSIAAVCCCLMKYIVPA